MTHGTYQSHGMQRPRRIVTILTVLALSISLGACGTAGDRKQEQSLRGQASAISGDADANAADASYRDEIAKSRTPVALKPPRFSRTAKSRKRSWSSLVPATRNA